MPLKLAWSPAVVLPPAPMTPLYGMFKAVTAAPLQVMAAFHEFTMVWLPGQVHVIFQVLVATVPVLLTVIVATKPLLQPLSTMLAEHLAVPALGVAVGFGVGVAGGGVGVGVLTGVGVAGGGVGVGVLTGVGVAGGGVGVGPPIAG